MIDCVFQISDDITVETHRLEEALRLTVKKIGLNKRMTVGLVITDDETVQAMNAQYRGIDAPTDVLSFENQPDPDFPIPQDEDAYLGDIIIAYPTAKRQAVNHTPMEEMILLTVHGMLHLLGFEHETPKEKTEMWAVQQQIMEALGLAYVQPTEQ